ncbi:electron transfer flavoprotein subunit alpha/FixB family protein [Sporolactobacillus sp. THM7-7]|nr:electron transfer flavoprotein subunit alpha/FixB family protein [Sporolactobacillus sp. THM7-7]
MGKKILIIAEKRQGQLKNVTLEALTAARKIASSDITVGIIGEANQGMIETLRKYGTQNVCRFAGQDLNTSNPDVAFHILLKLIETADPDIVLFGHSLMGKETVPRLASRLKMGLVSDVTKVDVNDDGIFLTRPIYSGKAYETVKPLSKKLVVTLRPNNIRAIPASRPAKAEITDLSIEAPDMRIHILRSNERNKDTVDLTEAKIIVAGGRGVQRAEGFKLLKALADRLGGAVGASRAACDAGYCDYALQIGQTGKVVTPDIYIACGISGAIQHLAGMSHSKRIIAINKDPDAPIFDVADYGFVGDLYDIIPKLVDKLSKPTTV